MMTGQEPADADTEPVSGSSIQTTLDEFARTEENQQSSILDDEMCKAELQESIEARVGTVNNPFYPQSGAMQAVQKVQQSTKSIRAGVVSDVQRVFEGEVKQTVRNLKEASRSAHLARRAVTPALATSAVASSTVAGVDPAVIQTMGQLPMQEVAEAVRGMAELNTPSLARMAAHEFQSLSTLPVSQLAERAAQQMQNVTRIAEQMAFLREGVTGVGAMGAVAARPGTVQGFDLPESGRAFEEQEASWLPAEPKPTVGGSFTFDLLPSSVDERVTMFFSAETAEYWEIIVHALACILFIRLQHMNPNQEIPLSYAQVAVILAVDLCFLLVKRRR